MALGDAAAARTARLALYQIAFPAEERARFRHALSAADDLERWRTRPDDEPGTGSSNQGSPQAR